MKIFNEPGQFAKGGATVCAAIGVFDGFHLGHRQVIAETLQLARARSAQAVVITFDRHPNETVAPARTPAMIMPAWKRIDTLAASGVDGVLVIPFDLAFSQRPGVEFIANLQTGFGRLAGLCVGDGFTFGFKRDGNLELLRRLGNQDGFEVRAVLPVAMGGAPVSSTRVRDLIRQGDFTSASSLLSTPYRLCGVVETGAQLGRTLGFPTANVSVPGLVLPPNGVYACRAFVGTQERPAAVNIGTRPSVAGRGVSVEAHLIGYSGDLYGARLELEFAARIREEENFPDLESLKRQIATDVVAAGQILNA